MANPKKRRKITDRFCHCFDFVPALAKQVARGTSTNLVELLRNQGAGETAHIIGDRSEIDAQDFPLEQAIELALADTSGVVISCVPGRLALFIKESPGDIFILSNKQ